MFVLELALLFAAILLALPILALTVESVAALLPLSRRRAVGERPAIDILVPAHNEANVIVPTLTTLLSQSLPGDRLCVVADNCTDNTAQLAAIAGVTVIERHDEQRRGKGFALAFGLQQLAPDHRPVTIIVDADCHVGEHALDRLAIAAQARQQPVQAAYLMYAPGVSSPRELISELAVYVKNYVRPRGLAKFGATIPLAGSGMAFPTTMLQGVRLDSGNLVEDMQLGIDLLLAGHPTLFCPEATVTAPLPQSTAASRVQRTRWEHGHLRTLLTQVPRLLLAGLKQCRLQLFVAALDVMIPPLTLLAFLWVALWLVCATTAAISTSRLPAIVVTLEGVILAVGLIVALIPNNQRRWTTLIVTIPLYMLSKASIYVQFLLRPQRAWLRTDRSVQS